MPILTAIHSDSAACGNKDLKFLDIRHLNGPNRWTYHPVLEVTIDIGELEDYPSNMIPGFYERLSSWLPSLIEHRCSYEERGDFCADSRKEPGQVIFLSTSPLSCKISPECREALAGYAKPQPEEYTRWLSAHGVGK